MSAKARVRHLALLHFRIKKAEPFEERYFKQIYK